MMGPCIGRFSLAVCMAAAGAVCIGVITLERRSEGMEHVATGPAVDAAEVAAVIAWAKEAAEARGGGDPDAAAAGAMPARGAAVRVVGPEEFVGMQRGSGAIVVPSNARAGGGKVSSIPGGHWGRHGTRRYPSGWGMRTHTQALNRSAPGLPPSGRSRSRSR